MDNKTSACVTGFVVCAMLYANVSATRADMRAPAVHTFTLANADAKPAAFNSPPRQATRGIEAEISVKEPPQAGTPAQRHFAKYLELHRSRIETAGPRQADHAAQL